MKITIDQNGVVVWNDGTKNTAAWVRGGSTVWPLTKEEEILAPEELYSLIESKWQKGQFYRCTGCGMEMKVQEVAGWPLFAGCACKPCWEKHLGNLEEERKKGHVCRMCGRPYGDCCC